MIKSVLLSGVQDYKHCFNSLVFGNLLNVSVLFKILPFKGFCNLYCFFLSTRNGSLKLDKFAEKKGYLNCLPFVVEDNSLKFDFKVIHNRTKIIIDISAFLSYILNNKLSCVQKAFA